MHAGGGAPPAGPPAPPPPPGGAAAGGAAAGGAAAGGAAVNMVALQPEHLRQLAALMRGSATKLRRMVDATPEAWLEYKRHFTKVAQLQHWDDVRQRREMAAGMQEKAGNAVSDIDPEGVADIDALTVLYEGRFMPAAAGITARRNYQSAKQLPTETVREWHTRVRELFTLAYPGDDINAVAHSIDLYVNGLANPNVRIYVASQVINQFHEALPVAERSETANRDVSGRPALNAMGMGGQGGGSSLACYFCQDVFKTDSPHMKNNCPYFRAAHQLWQQHRGQGAPPHIGGRGRGAGRGGRGRGRGRGRGHVNALNDGPARNSGSTGGEQPPAQSLQTYDRYEESEN